MRGGGEERERKTIPPTGEYRRWRRTNESERKFGSCSQIHPIKEKGEEKARWGAPAGGVTRALIHLYLCLKKNISTREREKGRGGKGGNHTAPSLASAEGDLRFIP